MNLSRYKAEYEEYKASGQLNNSVKKWSTNGKNLLLGIFRLIIIVGISYVILSPLIGIVSSSFFSEEDVYNPMVYLIPTAPTFERYTKAILRLNYWNVMRNTLLYTVSLTLIQLAVTSMVGYGFARFSFPCKKLLFGCVVIMIVIPTHTIMLPLYMSFASFDPFGILSHFGVKTNLLSSPIPMYILTLFGCGLRSGLYIYIFNQFFRGLPKEIEEAAFVDGAGPWKTYFRVMLPNAVPSIITVTVFSLVWQYNDTFYGKLFLVSDKILISKSILSLQSNISNLDKILDPSISQLYVYAGIVMLILPLVIMYVLLQRNFIEGVERSGIVG